MTTFKQLNLSEPVLDALEELNFQKPTSIQEQAIPILLNSDRDFIGLAQTGTGKTAAFGLPLVELLDPQKKETQALIISPTRELGQQIAEQINAYSKHKGGLNALVVYGGANISTQIKALKKPRQIIIATPGRLIDLIKRKAVKISNIQYLVLDEADEMLNMGFKEELDQILEKTPKNKRTWLFSATMPKDIKKIIRYYLTDPQEIKINPHNEVNTNIEHQYIVVSKASRMEALTRILDITPDFRGIVFCRTRRETQSLSESLLSLNYKVDALHGDLSQAQRNRVMKRFKDHELRVMIATDVAARGIDVTDLTHIIHFSLPDELSFYTHRSGRTARAGKQGISIAFINSRETNRIARIEKGLNISFSKQQIPKAEEIAIFRIEKWCQEILNKRTREKIDPAILERVNLLFGSLSKEELIPKILMHQMDKFLSIDDPVKTPTDTREKRKQHSKIKGYKHKRDRKPSKGSQKGKKHWLGKRNTN